MMLPNPILSAAIARPDALALESAEGSWTWAELCAEVRRAAAGFLAQGVGPGWRVALRGAAGKDFVVALHALGWVGAAVVPLSVGMTDAEVDAVLRATDVRAAVSLGDVTTGDVPRLSLVWAEDEAEERFWPSEEVRWVVTTSGTTGAPKVVSITAGQIAMSAFGSAIRLGHLPSDRWLACLPLHHVGGLSILMRCALYGTAVVLRDGFDALEVAQILDEGEASLVSLVPQMLAQVLDARSDAPFSPQLRCVLLGGGATSEALLARCHALSIPVSVTWGMTETASQVCTRTPGDTEQDAGVGRPMAFARVDVVSGALRVRGPIAPGGELITSDAGSVGVDGRVFVQGRADDAIISGGENIDPAEVEAVLTAHPAVSEAAVVAVPDTRWGQRPAAMLVGAEGSSTPEFSALKQWCRARLAPFKAPDHVFWRDGLPKGNLGKLQRHKVREEIMRDAMFRGRGPEGG